MCQQRKDSMRNDEMGRCRECQSKRAVAATLQRVRAPEFREFAQRVTGLSHRELQAEYDERAEAHDEMTRPLGHGQLSDGEWVPRVLQPAGAVVQLGRQLAGQREPEWMHTDIGCIGWLDRPCGWRKDLAGCRHCGASLCSWHRTVANQPRAGQGLGARLGGVHVQCGDHSSCGRRAEQPRRQG